MEKYVLTNAYVVILEYLNKKLRLSFLYKCSSIGSYMNLY